MALAGILDLSRKRKASETNLDQSGISEYQTLTPSKRPKMGSSKKTSNLLQRSFSKVKTFSRNFKKKRIQKTHQIKENDKIKVVQKSIEKCRNPDEAKSKFHELLQSYLPKQWRRKKPVKPDLKVETDTERTIELAKKAVEDTSWIMVPSASPKNEIHNKLSCLSPVESDHDGSDHEEIPNQGELKESGGQEFQTSLGEEYADQYDENYDHYGENIDPTHMTDAQLEQLYGSSQGKYVCLMFKFSKNLSLIEIIYIFKFFFIPIRF